MNVKVKGLNHDTVEMKPNNIETGVWCVAKLKISLGLEKKEKSSQMGH